jgi:hypothetical protein
MRDQRVLVLVVALLGARSVFAGPGTTSTAFVPSSTTATVFGTTTTTLVPPGCTEEPTFGSAGCRLDDLLERVATEDALGNLQEKLVRALDRAATQVEAAGQRCDAGNRRAANKHLRKAVRRLIRYGHRLRSLSARQKIPDAALRMELIDEGHAIQSDLVMIKRSGICPPASPSAAFVR